eukprot:267665_1
MAHVSTNANINAKNRIIVDCESLQSMVRMSISSRSSYIKFVSNSISASNSASISSMMEKLMYLFGVISLDIMMTRMIDRLSSLNKFLMANRSKTFRRNAPTRGDPNNNDKLLKQKYEKFVKKVKFSLQEAKNEAKRKRIRHKTINEYKRNNKVIERQQNHRHYSLYTQSVQDNTDGPSQEIKEDTSKIMEDEWTCIVVTKKNASIPTPPRAPPPRVPTESNGNNGNETGTFPPCARNDLRKSDHESNNTKMMPIVWQWCDDSGNWNKFGTSTCIEIEHCYINQMDKYEYDMFGRTYYIDFAEMKQYNNLNQAWKVRRRNNSIHNMNI